MTTPHWLKNLYKLKTDTVTDLVRFPHIPTMLTLSIEDKMELFKRISSSLKDQVEFGENYSIEDRIYLREIKNALIKDLSELKD